MRKLQYLILVLISLTLLGACVQESGELNPPPTVTQTQKPEETPSTDGENLAAIVKDSTPVVLKAAVTNGKYLCETPDQKILFARSYELSEQSDERGATTPIFTRVYITGADGTVEETRLPEFTDIEKARYSPTGDYLALLDLDGENRILYIFDTQTGKLLNMGEEGLGLSTADFCWGVNNTLYSISGNYEAMQLMKADLTGELAISSVEERQITQGRVAFVGNTLFLCDLDDDEGIFKVDVQTGARERLAKGLVFEVSPNGRYLVALSLREGEEEGELVDVNLLDLQEGSELLVAQNIFIAACGFVDNTLYLLTNSEREDYPSLLQYFDIQTKELKEQCLTLAETFTATPNKGLVLPVFMDEKNYYVTYLYDIKNS